MENNNNSENLTSNNFQNINNNNTQNIIISANGITSEQTKMIEAFVMFQKFMNFTPELNKQIIINNNNNLKNINNNNNTNTNIQSNNSNNINNTKDNNNNNLNNINEKNDDIIFNDKDKIRKWNPIRRNKTKNYEKNKINLNDNNNNNSTNEIQNIIIKNINTNYNDIYHSNIIYPKNESKNIDKKIDNNEKLSNNNLKEDIYKEEPKKINNFDDLPIKSNNLIEINANNEKIKNKINNFQIEKNSKSSPNIDDIIIKPSASNFMELLEKNLKNEKTNYPNDNKEIKKQCINNGNNNQKANLDLNKSKERILKQEKIKQNKEKAKEIEKNAHLNYVKNAGNISKKENKKENKVNINHKNSFDKNNFNNIKKYNINHNKTYFDIKNIQNLNNNPIKISTKLTKKWSKAKFGTLDENDYKNDKSPMMFPQVEVKNNNNPKKRPKSLTKNIFRNKKKIEHDNNKNNEKENDILDYMNKEIKNNENYNKKLNEYNTELAKLEKEKEKLKKLKEEYENLNSNLQKEKALYKQQREEEMRNFDNFVIEEMKLINKEKKQLSIEQKSLNELRVKYQMNNKLDNKKGKNEIEKMKVKLTEKHKEINRKDNNDKILIDKYKKQLQEAYNQIDELNALINSLKEKNNTNQNNENIVENNNNNNDVNINYNNNYISQEYDLIFPEKYHGITYNLIKTETTKDGKRVNFYDNNKKEIIFKNGVRKEIFNDEYQVIYFNNGDIKQIYPGENKQIYYFKEKNIVQTTIGDECQIFKYENGQIEKKFKDGTVQIIFPDGQIKNILPNGYEEIYNINEDT